MRRSRSSGSLNDAQSAASIDLSKAPIVLSRDTGQDRRIFHLGPNEIDPFERERLRIRRPKSQNLKFIECRLCLVVKSLLGSSCFLDRVLYFLPSVGHFFLPSNDTYRSAKLIPTNATQIGLPPPLLN